MNLKIFENFRPSTSNFKSFSRSLEQFFFSQYVRTISVTNYHLTMEIFFSLHFKTPPPSLLYRGGAKLVLSWLSIEQLQLHLLFPPFFLFCLILYSMHFVVHKMKFSTSVHTMKQPNCTDELH